MQKEESKRTLKFIVKIVGMKKYLILLLITATASSTHGQTLRDYLKEAAENNPGVKAAFGEFQAAREKTSQAAGLPDPELSVEYLIEPLEYPMGAHRADISIMQMFPWFGALRAAGDEAARIAEARFEAFLDEKNQLFFEVKNLWYELYRLEQEINLTKDNLDILKSYERMAMTRFRSGGIEDGKSGGDMVDVLRAQMDIREMENILATLQAAKEPLAARFNALLNRSADEPVIIADTLIPQEIDPLKIRLPEDLFERHPMVRMFEVEESAYESQEKTAVKEGLPRFGVGVNYMIMEPVTSAETQMKMGGENMIMPMVSFTLPIYRKKYDAAAKEAKVRQEIARYKQQQVKNELTATWREAMTNLEDAERALMLYREQEILAGQALRLLTTSYTSEGTDFEEVLRTRRQLIDYRLKLVNAVVDQHVALARLTLLSATELKNFE